MEMPVNWNEGTGLPSPFVAAIEEIAAYFDGVPGVDALLLTCSWARGKGNVALGSDCDLILLHNNRFDLSLRGTYEQWQAGRDRAWNLAPLGPYSRIDLYAHNGLFVPRPRSWTSGPDEFELEIGNILAYSRPIATWTDRYRYLREQWLPYYAEDLRASRLAMVLMYARNNLNHIPPFSQRGLYFQCLKRLHHAVEETIQALFISARRYPIAYDKWVEEQVSEILGRPDIYNALVQAVTIPQLDAATFQEKAALVSTLLDEIEQAG
jgi:hypothetical protein